MPFPTKKQLLLATLVFFLGLASPFIFSSLINLFRTETTLPNQQINTNLSRTPPIQTSSQSFSILFLGHGGAGHPGGDLADAIQIAHIIPEKKMVALISIPRDLWVPMQGGHYKINHALDFGNTTQNIHGGGELTSQIRTNITGLSIEHYVSVNFEGFKQSIDLLGGITVDVPVTFDEYYYPIPGEEANICGKTPSEMTRIHTLYSGFELEKQFECRYEHLHFDAGPLPMDGNLTLKFIRSRHSNEHGGDFARGQRQQAVLVGVFKKVISLKALENALPFARQFSFAVRTNIDESTLLDLLKLAGKVNQYEITNINLDDNLLDFSTSSDGQSILIPKAGLDNWGEITSYVHENL